MNEPKTVTTRRAIKPKSGEKPDLFVPTRPRWDQPALEPKPGTQPGTGRQVRPGLPAQDRPTTATIRREKSLVAEQRAEKEEQEGRSTAGSYLRLPVVGSALGRFNPGRVKQGLKLLLLIIALVASLFWLLWRFDLI